MLDDFFNWLLGDLNPITYKKTEYFSQTGNTYKNVASDKGKTGEFHIPNCLQQLQGYKKYLFNCYIPKQDSSTSEVDVILLHESGIYVFEVKNFSGWIFGTESNQYWTQTLPDGNGGSHKYHFFNPIIQNSSHIKWLQSYLKENPSYFYSFIVFGDQCTLKDVNLTSGNHWVLNQYYLFSEVLKHANTVGRLLSPDKIDSIYSALFPLTQVDEFQKWKHIDTIYKNHPQKDTESLNQQRCPQCGGKLVMRTAHKGANIGKRFWGCSNYPKCTYIKNIEE